MSQLGGRGTETSTLLWPYHTRRSHCLRDANRAPTVSTGGRGECPGRGETGRRRAGKVNGGRVTETTQASLWRQALYTASQREANRVWRDLPSGTIAQMWKMKQRQNIQKHGDREHTWTAVARVPARVGGGGGGAAGRRREGCVWHSACVGTAHHWR